MVAESDTDTARSSFDAPKLPFQLLTCTMAAGGDTASGFGEMPNGSTIFRNQKSIRSGCTILSASIPSIWYLTTIESLPVTD